MNYLKDLKYSKPIKDKLNLSVHCNVHELKGNKDFKLSSLFIYNLEEFMEFLNMSSDIIIDDNFYLRYYGSSFNKTVQEFLNLCSIYGIYIIEVSMNFFRTLDRLDIDLSNFSFILRDTTDLIPIKKFKCNIVIADFKVTKKDITNITNSFDFNQALIINTKYKFITHPNIVTLEYTSDGKIISYNDSQYESINTSFYDTQNHKYLNLLDFLEATYNP